MSTASIAQSQVEIAHELRALLEAIGDRRAPQPSQTARIRVLGADLFAIGGCELMLRILYSAADHDQQKISVVDWAWIGIGDWAP
jgi:hypothetical protein